MSDAFEEFEVDGLTIGLHYDEDSASANPRDWSNTGQLYGVGRDFPCDDERNRIGSGWDAEEALREYAASDGAAGGVVIAVWFDDYGSRGARIYDVASLEDANGLYVVPAAVIAEDWTPFYPSRSGAFEAARLCALAELRTLDAWLQGEVYGYSIASPGGETLGGCWGFVGDAELPYMRESATDEARAIAAELSAAMESPNLSRALEAARTLADA